LAPCAIAVCITEKPAAQRWAFLWSPTNNHVCCCYRSRLLQRGRADCVMSIGDETGAERDRDVHHVQARAFEVSEATRASGRGQNGNGSDGDVSSRVWTAAL
jgi:hypothetical protein